MLLIIKIRNEGKEDKASGKAKEFVENAKKKQLILLISKR